MTCRVVLCALLLLPLSAIAYASQVAKPQTGSSKQRRVSIFRRHSSTSSNSGQTWPYPSCKKR